MGQEQLEAPRLAPRFNAAQLAAVAFLVAVVAGWTAFVLVARIGIEGLQPVLPGNRHPLRARLQRGRLRCHSAGNDQNRGAPVARPAPQRPARPGVGLF